jgi:hypothetical protein
MTSARASRWSLSLPHVRNVRAITVPVESTMAAVAAVLMPTSMEHTRCSPATKALLVMYFGRQGLPPQLERVLDWFASEEACLQYLERLR